MNTNINNISDQIFVHVIVQATNQIVDQSVQQVSKQVWDQVGRVVSDSVYRNVKFHTYQIKYNFDLRP